MKVKLLTTSLGCATCEKAKALLTELQEELGFAVEEVDIMEQPEEAQEHDLLTSPGIVIDGELRFRGVPNRAELEEALMGALE